MQTAPIRWEWTGGGSAAPMTGQAMLVLAHDPAVTDATAAAARALREPPPLLVGSGAEALRRLVAPGPMPRHLVCEAGAAGAAWPELLATANDSAAPMGVVVGGGAGRDGLPPHVETAPAEAEDARALRRGLRRGEIVLRCQPVVRLRDRRVVMVEALARWNRGDGRAIAAGAFVPLAGRAGLARALAHAVVERAAREIAALGGSAAGLAVAVNLPLAVLQEADPLVRLRRMLAAARLPPSRLVLELTETETVRGHAWLRRALTRLRAARHPVLLDGLALDDERRWLLDLPFSGLKLDRTLVAQLPRNARARAQSRDVVAEARRRGLSVTAEGVESAALWRACVGLGLDRAQGFAVGRPLPADALPAWIAAWRAAPWILGGPIHASGPAGPPAVRSNASDAKLGRPQPAYTRR